MKTMTTEKNVFLTDDIVLADWEHDDIERYEYTEDLENFLEYVANYCDEATEDEKNTADSFLDTFPASYEDVREWIDGSDTHARLYDDWRDNVSYEEQYTVPMMNSLRYYPDFVDFDEADRYKVRGACTLVYDSERRAWAVGMSGGGMNLAPDLLATFINLGKGVPTELADGIKRNYSGNVRENEHAENCDLLARAYENKALAMLAEAGQLRENENAEVARHIKGLRTAIEKTHTK